MTTYFVSGHLDLTEAEFNEFYRGRISAAVALGASFVVGDARGCDSMAQALLEELGCRRVTVLHMLHHPRNNRGFKTLGGFRTDEQRDEAMTTLSNADIAWVRPGRESSGTAKNIERRKTST